MLFYDLAVNAGYIAEVLCGSKDIASLVEVAAHTDGTVIALLAMEALREILAANRTNAFRLRRFASSRSELNARS